MGTSHKKGWRYLIPNLSSGNLQTVSGADIGALMEQASAPSFRFYFLLVLSGAIATFGLLSNSAPAIIGAMIIAPLMSPIISLAHALVIAAYGQMLRSLFTIATGVAMVVGLSFLLATWFGISIAGSELISRTQPTLLDLGIAIASGAAAAYAYSRSDVLNSIAGVAVAVALVPPLAVVGVGLTLGSIDGPELHHSLKEAGLDGGTISISQGAFLLFIINLFAIVLSAGVIMICQRYGSLRKGITGLGVTAAILLMLLEPLEESFHKIYVESQARKIANELVRTNLDLRDSHGWAVTVHVRYIGEQLNIFVKSVIPREDVQNEKKLLQKLQKSLSEELEEPVVIQATTIPVDLNEFRFGPE